MLPRPPQPGPTADRVTVLHPGALDADGRDVGPGALIAAAREHLAPSTHPQVVDRLPPGTSGEVLRRALAEQHGDESTTTTEEQR